jgi:hypothetical protein
MSKGGFVLEMMASKHATNSYNFLWRYLYYMYIGLPLLVVYFILFQVTCAYVVLYVQDMLGLKRPNSFEEISTLNWIGLAAVNLGFIVALYHFRILPILLIPVHIIMSI